METHQVDSRKEDGPVKEVDPPGGKAVVELLDAVVVVVDDDLPFFGDRAAGRELFVDALAPGPFAGFLAGFQVALFGFFRQGLEHDVLNGFEDHLDGDEQQQHHQQEELCDRIGDKGRLVA